MRAGTTRDDWDLTSERNEEIAAEIEAGGNADFAKQLRHSNQDVPVRREVWIAAAQSWRQLCNSTLSNEAVEAWFIESGK